MRPPTSPDWRPFKDSLSARSVAHTLSILGALFRWPIEQRNVLASPFSRAKVHSASGAQVLDTLLTKRDLRVLPVSGNPTTLVVGSVETDHEPLAGKLRRASPHWMRHTHALGRGAEFTTVRVATTSAIYLHSDEMGTADR